MQALKHYDHENFPIEVIHYTQYTVVRRTLKRSSEGKVGRVHEEGRVSWSGR